MIRQNKMEYNEMLSLYSSRIYLIISLITQLRGRNEMHYMFFCTFLCLLGFQVVIRHLLFTKQLMDIFFCNTHLICTHVCLSSVLLFISSVLAPSFLAGSVFRAKLVVVGGLSTPKWGNHTFPWISTQIDHVSWIILQVLDKFLLNI